MDNTKLIDNEEITNQFILDYIKKNYAFEFADVVKKTPFSKLVVLDRISLASDLILLIGKEQFNIYTQNFISEEVKIEIDEFVNSLTDEEKKYIMLLLTNVNLLNIGFMMLSEAIKFYIQFFRARNSNIILQRSGIDETK